MAGSLGCRRAVVLLVFLLSNSAPQALSSSATHPKAKEVASASKGTLYEVPNFVEQRTRMHFPQAEAGWLDKAAAGMIGDDVKTDDEKGNLTAIIKEWHDKAYAEKAQARVDAFNKALEENYDEYNTTLGKAYHKIFQGKQVQGKKGVTLAHKKASPSLNAVKKVTSKDSNVMHKVAMAATGTLSQLFEIPMQKGDCVGSDCYQQDQFENPRPEGTGGDEEGSEAAGEGSDAGGEGAEGSDAAGEGAEGSGAQEGEGSGVEESGGEESEDSGAEEGKGSGTEEGEGSGTDEGEGSGAEEGAGDEGSGSGAEGDEGEGSGSGVEGAEGSEGSGVEYPVSIQLTDASTGNGILSPGALRFEQDGVAVKVVDFETGAEEVEAELPKGVYSMMVVAPGYNTEAVDIKVPREDTAPIRSLVSHTMGPTEMEISMQWDPEVTDMDMHIALPSGCVVYRLNQKCTWGNMEAEIIAENRTHGGPITAKITDMVPGDYAIYATRYTVGHQVLRSQAKVQVNLPGGKMKYFQIGSKGVIGELRHMVEEDLPPESITGAAAGEGANGIAPADGSGGAITNGASMQMRRGGRLFKAGGMANAWFATILRYKKGHFKTCHADKKPLCSEWAAAAASTPKSTQAWVYGHVLDIDTGVPVPSANVDLVYSGSSAVRTHSGTDGSYLLQSVPAGFELIAHRAGYCVESEDVRLQSGMSKKRRLFMGRELLFKQMRIALTWGDDALDSVIHVTTPAGCTIDSENPECTKGDLDGAMDHNKDRVHGPKTVLFSSTVNGNYGIYVSRTGGESLEGKYVKVRIQFPGCEVTSTRRYKLGYGDGQLGSGTGDDFTPGGDKTVWKVGVVVANGPDFCVAGKDDGCKPRVEPVESEEPAETPVPEESPLPDTAGASEEAEEKEEDEEIEKEDQIVEKAPMVFGGDDMPEFGGYIQDSATGYKINRVHVQLMWGGQAVLDYSSKSWGRFKFNAPPAPYQVKASMAGYITASENVRVSEDGTQYGELPVRIVLSKILEPGQLRIVLTWDLEPKNADMDLHVVTPLNIGRRYPIVCRIGPGYGGGSCGRRYKRRRPRKDEDYIYGRRDADWRHDGGPKSIWFDRMLDGTYYVYAIRDDKGTKRRSGSSAERLRTRYGLGIPMNETGLRCQIYLPKTGAEGIRDYKIERGEGTLGSASVIDKRDGGGINFTPGAEDENGWFVAEIIVSGGHATVKSTSSPQPALSTSEDRAAQGKAELAKSSNSKLHQGRTKGLKAEVAKRVNARGLNVKPAQDREAEGLRLTEPAKQRLLAIWAAKGHQGAEGVEAGASTILFASGGAFLLMAVAVTLRLAKSSRRSSDQGNFGAEGLRG